MAKSDWHHLYDTKRWKARRLYQLGIEPLCRLCQERGVLTPATIADHIVPHRGDVTMFFEGELQSLCKRCHDGTKQHQERTGVLRGCDAQGKPLDPGHHWSL